MRLRLIGGPLRPKMKANRKNKRRRASTPDLIQNINIPGAKRSLFQRASQIHGRETHVIAMINGHRAQQLQRPQALRVVHDLLMAAAVSVG